MTEQELTNKCIQQAYLLGRMIGLVAIMFDRLTEKDAMSDEIYALHQEVYEGTNDLLCNNGKVNNAQS